MQREVILIPLDGQQWKHVPDGLVARTPAKELSLLDPLVRQFNAGARPYPQKRIGGCRSLEALWIPSSLLTYKCSSCDRASWRQPLAGFLSCTSPLA